MVQATETPSALLPAEDLVRALHSVLQVYKRTMTDPIDRAMIFVLGEIQNREPVRLTELAAPVGLDGSTVSRHVSRLVELGLVDRSRDPDDARAQRLVVTDRGRDHLEDVRRSRAATFEAAVSSWSVTDRRRLVALMTRLGDDLARVATGDDSRESPNPSA
jgi:DNA-binding MarR family transcriptional regulator